MNDALKDVLRYLLRQKVIGGKHIPERCVINKKIMRLRLPERREFFKEYKSLINQGYIFRQKKRTGKGDEEHVSLNPEVINDMKAELSEEGEPYEGNFL